MHSRVYVGTSGWSLMVKRGLGANKLVAFVLHVAREFSEKSGTIMAASAAFYSFFSLFPFMLLVITVTSYFFDPSAIKQQMIVVAAHYLPEAVPLVEENAARMLAIRSQVGAVAVVGVFWASSNVFSILQTALNRIFEAASQPSFFLRKARDLLISASLVGLIILAVVANTLMRTVAVMVEGRLLDWTTQGLGIVLPSVVTIIAFFLAYRLMALTAPSALACLAGAVAAGLGTEAVRLGFTYYMSTLTPYQLVYGSLGVFIAVMFWIYATLVVFLLGAQVAASVDHHRQHV